MLNWIRVFFVVCAVLVLSLDVSVGSASTLLDEHYENSSSGVLSAVAYVGGFSGLGAGFDDEADYIQYSTNYFPLEGTFEAKIYVTALDDDSTESTIFDSNGADAYSGIHISLGIKNADSKPVLSLWGDGLEVRQSAVSDVAIEFGRWYGIAASWGSEGMYLYLDGRQVGHNSYTGARGGETVYLGDCPEDNWASEYYSQDYRRSFLGVLDNVRTSNVQNDVSVVTKKSLSPIVCLLMDGEAVGDEVYAVSEESAQAIAVDAHTLAKSGIALSSVDNYMMTVDDKYVWMGGLEGSQVARIDRAARSVSYIPLLNAAHIYTPGADASKVYVPYETTGGASSVAIITKETLGVVYQAVDDTVFDIDADQNYLWCACYNGVVRASRSDFSSYSFVSLPSQFIWQVSVDDTYAWAIARADSSFKLYRIDKSTLGYTQYTLAYKPLSVMADDTYVWIGFIGGVARLNKAGSTIQYLSISDVYNISVDADSLWVAGYNMHRYDKSTLSETSVSVGERLECYGEMTDYEYKKYFSE